MSIRKVPLVVKITRRIRHKTFQYLEGRVIGFDGLCGLLVALHCSHTAKGDTQMRTRQGVFGSPNRKSLHDLQRLALKPGGFGRIAEVEVGGISLQIATPAVSFRQIFQERRAFRVRSDELLQDYYGLPGVIPSSLEVPLHPQQIALEQSRLSDIESAIFPVTFRRPLRCCPASSAFARASFIEAMREFAVAIRR